MKRRHDLLEDEADPHSDGNEVARINNVVTKRVSHNGKHCSNDPVTNHLGDHWQILLEKLRTPSTTDIIHECGDYDPSRLLDHVEEYFLLANNKLHVFPFKDVHPCWHRLYTDASIVKAVNIIRSSKQDGNTQDSVWLDETIRILDMAMITTGGYGREHTIEEVYSKLEDIIDTTDYQERLSERPETTDFLCSDDCSIPKLKFPVQQSLRSPSLTVFEKHMHHKKEPVILTNILEHWPALVKWRSIEYWNRLTFAGRRLVPVELGRSYVDDDWGQRIIPFKDFLNEYILNESDVKGYLAQYDLFHHLPMLNKDLVIPDFCFLDAPPPDPDTPVGKANMKGGLKSAKVVDDGDVQKNIWFGPPWTISPLHHDPYHNILCQVVGKKYIRLYSPRHSSRLYPRAENEPAPHGEGTIDMSNTSTVDIAAMELSPDEDWDDKWPDISTVPYQEVILDAGQALYIPVGWWHYVRSCSIGISVSFWWS